MPEFLDKTEADIDSFHKARKKFYSCPNANIFYFIGSCGLLTHTFDTSTDMLYYCSSCKFNKKSPSFEKIKARFG